MKWTRLQRSHFLVKGSKTAGNKHRTVANVELFVNVGAVKFDGPFTDE
jgi:hypothetical protein